MMDGQLQFVSVTGLTFATVGIALLILLILHVWILVAVTRTMILLTRVLRRAKAAERARREIQERDRIRIARMIRRKVSDDEWAALLAELGEDPTQSKE
jgi:biopolymer transport protein ExbB/TolQ